MAILKNKEIAKMSETEIKEKIMELKMELIKEKIAASKGGKLKTKEIKKTIARLLTFDRINKKASENFLRNKNSQKNIKNVKNSVKE
ncbi:MAG: 50S ribosomal protein L29 [Candidatus Pacearchaeota archaeon]